MASADDRSSSNIELTRSTANAVFERMSGPASSCRDQEQQLTASYALNSSALQVAQSGAPAKNNQLISSSSSFNHLDASSSKLSEGSRGSRNATATSTKSHQSQSRVRLSSGTAGFQADKASYSHCSYEHDCSISASLPKQSNGKDTKIS
jgi:hypothetical protein